MHCILLSKCYLSFPLGYEMMLHFEGGRSPQAHMFECMVPRWWYYFEEAVGLATGDGVLGVDF